MKNKELEKFKKLKCYNCYAEFYYGSKDNFYFGTGGMHDIYICNSCVKKMKNKTEDVGPK